MKKLLILSVLFLVMAGSYPALSVEQEYFFLNPSLDATVEQENPNNKYTTRDYLYVESYVSSTNKRVYVKFNTKNFSYVNVTSAVLKLYCNDTGYDPLNRFYEVRTTGDWGAGPTWYIQPEVSDDNVTMEIDSPGWWNVTVTSLLSSVSGEIRFRIKDTEESSGQQNQWSVFRSRLHDNVSTRPILELTINYTLKYIFHGVYKENGDPLTSKGVTVHYENDQEDGFTVEGITPIYFGYEPRFFVWDVDVYDRIYYPDDETNITLYVPEGTVDLYTFSIRDYSGITQSGGWLELYRPGCSGEYESQPVERHDIASVINMIPTVLSVGASYDIRFKSGSSEYDFGVFLASALTNNELIMYAPQYDPRVKMAYKYVHADARRSLNNTLIIVDYEDINVNTTLVELFIIEQDLSTSYYSNSTVSTVQFQWNQANSTTDYVAYVRADHGDFGEVQFKIPLPWVYNEGVPTFPFEGLVYLGSFPIPARNLFSLLILTSAILCFSYLTGPAGLLITIIVGGMLRWMGWVEYTMNGFEADMTLLAILGSLAILWALAEARRKNR